MSTEAKTDNRAAVNYGRLGCWFLFSFVLHRTFPERELALRVFVVAIAAILLQLVTVILTRTERKEPSDGR